MPTAGGSWLASSWTSLLIAVIAQKPGNLVTIRSLQPCQGGFVCGPLQAAACAAVSGLAPLEIGLLALLEKGQTAPVPCFRPCDSSLVAKMAEVSEGTGRRSPLLERGAEHGGGEQRRQEAADVGKASTRWHELVSELARPALSQPKAPAAPQYSTATEALSINQNSPPHSPERESQAVRSTLEKAVQAAKADAQWSASGLPESLQRTVQLCSSEGPGAAKTAALGLLDFHQIVKNTKLRSPKTPSPPVSPHREEERPNSKQGKGCAFCAASCWTVSNVL